MEIDLGKQKFKDTKSILVYVVSILISVSVHSLSPVLLDDSLWVHCTLSQSVLDSCTESFYILFSIQFVEYLANLPID